MVRTLRFHCRGHKFNPWSGSLDPAGHAAQPKKKKSLPGPHSYEASPYFSNLIPCYFPTFQARFYPFAHAVLIRKTSQIPTWLVPRRLQVPASASFPVRSILTTLYKMSQPDIRCCNQTRPSFGPIPDPPWSATPPLGQSECSARHALLHTRTPASLTPAAPSAFSPQHYHWQRIYFVTGCLMPLLLKCIGSLPVSCTTVPPTRRTGPGKENRTMNGRVNE